MKNDYKNILKSQGLKVTPIRIKLLEIIHNASKPIDVLFISKHLDIVTADEATIYRNVNEFIQKGLLRKVFIEEGKMHFEITSLPHHHHAICSDCGKIEEVATCDFSSLEKDLEKKFSFKVKQHNLEFFGQCASCR